MRTTPGGLSRRFCSGQVPVIRGARGAATVQRQNCVLIRGVRLSREDHAFFLCAVAQHDSRHTTHEHRSDRTSESELSPQSQTVCGHSCGCGLRLRPRVLTVNCGGCEPRAGFVARGDARAGRPWAWRLGVRYGFRM